MEFVADTTVLIDIWRRKSRPESLQPLLKIVGESPIYVPWVVRAEFLRGAYLTGCGKEAGAFLQKYSEPLEFRESCIERYARTWAEMRQTGDHVDYPDLWVACAAIEEGLPLITRNAAHFRQIPNLDLVEYALA